MDDDIFLVHPQICTEHSFHDLARFYNGCSAWGTKICQKCGTNYEWQYDYETQYHSTIDTKPYQKGVIYGHG